MPDDLRRDPVVAAVDIGGTRIKAALVDRGLQALVERTVPTPQLGGEQLLDAVDELVTGMLDELGDRPDEGPDTGPPPGRTSRLTAAAVVLPGLVDTRAGVARLSVNLGWRDLAVAEPLTRRWGVPVALGHDVRAGLLAEARIGAARLARHVMFVPVGTGIAAALMVDGVVVDADGWAGELGHCIVQPDGEPCACGQRGCLEAVASASALERSYHRRSGIPRSAHEVAVLAAAGDPLAATVWAEVVAHLARALLTATTLTGIDLVVVGGGLAESGDQLLVPLQAHLDAARTFQRPVRVVRAGLGDRAGCLGAACLAWQLG